MDSWGWVTEIHIKSKMKTQKGTNNKWHTTLVGLFGSRLVKQPKKNCVSVLLFVQPFFLIIIQTHKSFTWIHLSTRKLWVLVFFCFFSAFGHHAGGKSVQSNDYKSIQSVNYSPATQTTSPRIAHLIFQSAVECGALSIWLNSTQRLHQLCIFTMELMDCNNSWRWLD